MRRLLPLLLIAASCAAAGCAPLHPGAPPDAGPPPEPDVFAVIRASNSKAAVEQLRSRHAEEVLHARLLEARIGELIAAEEGLAAEYRERQQSVQSMRDQVRKLADEQAELQRAIDAATKQQAELARRLAETQQQGGAPAAPDAAKPAADGAKRSAGGD